ncbi:hypothetical protein AB0M43_33620 [Longispora sp. NPDC051575]|uniref:hypothetical protein n=1 Tax=Longispora sp. NPDC051575 TaxID=3154943 RepID=UPI00342FE2C6
MTEPTPPVSGPTRVELLAAMRAARFAALRGLPLKACPYSVTGDGRARILARHWVAEYLLRRPHAPGVVDYDA